MVNSMITNSRLNFKFSCYEEVRPRSTEGKMVGTVEHMKGRNVYVLSDVTVQNVYEFNNRVVNEFRRIEDVSKSFSKIPVIPTIHYCLNVINFSVFTIIMLMTELMFARVVC